MEGWKGHKIFVLHILLPEDVFAKTSVYMYCEILEDKEDVKMFMTK